jgi:hypothetical protein
MSNGIQTLVKIVVGGAVVLSPIGDIPIRIYLANTEFGKAFDPLACFQLVASQSILPVIPDPCRPLNRLLLLIKPINVNEINVMIVIIGLVLIAWGIYDRREDIKGLLG